MDTNTMCDEAAPRIRRSGLAVCGCGRRCFFDAGQAVLVHFNLEATSVERICRAAGLSPSEFFRHFRDLRDFYAQLVAAVLNGATVAWEANATGDQDPVNRLKSLVDMYEETVREHPFLHVLAKDAVLMRQSIAQNRQIRLKQQGGPLECIIRDGVEMGQFASVDPSGSVWRVFSILEAVYIQAPRTMPGHSALRNPQLAEQAKLFILCVLGVNQENTGSHTGSVCVECRS